MMELNWNIIILTAAAIVVIVIIAIILKKKHDKKYKDTLDSIKGKASEHTADEEFEKFFRDKCEFRLLKNVYLKYDDKTTTGIDMIFVTEYGIFVAENKNYNGCISGNSDDEKWTNSYPTGVKFRFANPLKQNEQHIGILKKYVGEKYQNMIYSYIIFDERCEFKQAAYKSEYVRVIKPSKIHHALTDNAVSKCMTVEEVGLLCNKLSKFTDVHKNIS